MTLRGDYAGPFDPDFSLADLSRTALGALTREWLLHGHLQDRVGIPLLYQFGVDREGAEQTAIDEWASASPLYSLRMQDTLGFRGDTVDVILKNLQQISTFLFNRATTIFKGLSTFLIGFFFTLLSLYYLFKDGGRLLEKIKEIIPIPSRERDLFFLRFKEMIHATFRGGILVAMIQGILGGLSFWILGISSPILWGTAMAILSFIPVGGTALVWIPASVFLWIQGAWVKAITLLGIGIFVISMADNIVRPALISSKTNIHPLLLFFAVLGGIQAFGLIGLLLGPLITSLCLTIIEIYIQGIKEE